MRSLLPDVESSDVLAFRELVGRYGEPHRRYHGWAHVIHCIEQFDLAIGLLQDPDAVEMALWFHDAIYVPRAANNESKSAALFRSVARGQFSEGYISKVCLFTLLTRHTEAPREPDGCFVVDIDLSSLALDWEEFLEDSDHIRQEQSDMPDPRFYSAQARFLKSLLSRPRIFHSDFFHDRCERTARLNITRFIARLQSQGFVG